MVRKRLPVLGWFFDGNTPEAAFPSATYLSAAKTSVVSAAKTSALSAAKTSALSAVKTSALSPAKTSAFSHTSMIRATTCARLRRAHVVAVEIEV